MKNRILMYAGLGEHARYYIDTVNDVEPRSGIQLFENLRVGFYDEDATEIRVPDNLLFEGITHYDPDRHKWYALLDWSSFRHESDEDGTAHD